MSVQYNRAIHVQSKINVIYMFILYKKYVTITINTQFVEYKNKIYINI